MDNEAMTNVLTYSCTKCVHFKENPRKKNQFMCALYSLCKAGRPLNKKPGFFEPR